VNKYCLTLLLTIALGNQSSANTFFSLRPTLHHFDYTEFGTTGQQLDRETGWIPGIGFQLHTKLSKLLYASIDISRYDGAVDYNGQTQARAPHTTTTDEIIDQFGFRLAIPITAKTELFGSQKYLNWKRDIKNNSGVFGLFEEYTWQETSVGVKTKLWQKNNQKIFVEIGLLYISNPEIFVDLSRINQGSATLQIGEKIGGRAQLEWKRIGIDTWSFGLNSYLEYWKFDRSNTGITQGGSPNVFITEPKSGTQNIGLQFVITRSF